MKRYAAILGITCFVSFSAVAGQTPAQTVNLDDVKLGARAFACSILADMYETDAEVERLQELGIRILKPHFEVMKRSGVPAYVTKATRPRIQSTQVRFGSVDFALGKYFYATVGRITRQLLAVDGPNGEKLRPGADADEQNAHMRKTTPVLWKHYECEGFRQRAP